VADTSLRYRRPARLDDLLEITVVVRHSAAASLEISQQAFRDGELLVEGEIRIGFVQRATMRPARIPVHVLEALVRKPADSAAG
jgi:acyl-CoA thioester hydrolase